VRGPEGCLTDAQERAEGERLAKAHIQDALTLTTDNPVDWVAVRHELALASGQVDWLAETMEEERHG
jgi:hypothetical protein